jgi:hypothetical protein
MEALKRHNDWINAMLDGLMPAWRLTILPDYRIICMFCDKKETFPVFDFNNNTYVNVDFYDPRYVASVFGLSSDRSFFKPEAKAYLKDFENKIKEFAN